MGDKHDATSVCLREISRTSLLPVSPRATSVAISGAEAKGRSGNVKEE